MSTFPTAPPASRPVPLKFFSVDTDNIKGYQYTMRGKQPRSPTEAHTMEILGWLAIALVQFTPWWAKALLLASPLAIGAILLARAKAKGPGPLTTHQC